MFLATTDGFPEGSFGFLRSKNKHALEACLKSVGSVKQTLDVGSNPLPATKKTAIYQQKLQNIKINFLVNFVPSGPEVVPTTKQSHN